MTDSFVLEYRVARRQFLLLGQASCALQIDMGFFRRRILTSIVVFFAAINLDFFLPRLVPGNAAQIFASGTKLPAQEVILLSQRFGLDQPLYVQYFLFMKGIFAS